MVTTTLKKYAANDGNDIPFEQAFSSIAHSYLQDAAPMLLEHEIGFQLLDRSADNQRAAGVMGFKVGSQLLLAPVFFLGGKLKGSELLYIANEDLFVPLTEKWVLRLLNQKPLIIGKGIRRDVVNKAVRWPNLDQLRRPTAKYASANDSNWFDYYLPVYAAMRTRPQSMLKSAWYEQADLPNLLKQASADLVKRLLVTVQAYPWLEQQLEQFHGPDFLKRAVANARPVPAAPEAVPQPGLFDHLHPVKNGALQIFTLSTLKTSVLPAELTEEEQEELAKEEFVIRDKRDPNDPDAPISKAYRVAKNWNLNNPTESGIYDVLLAGGRLEKCVVLVKPRNGTKVTDAVVVFPLQGERDWFAAANSKVWVNHKYSDKDWSSWYKALPDTESIRPGRSRYLVLNENGTGTQPFHVKQSITDDDGRRSLQIQFDYTPHNLLESRFAQNTDDAAPQLSVGGAHWSTDTTWLIIKPETFGRFNHSGDGLVAPKQFKVVELATGDDDSWPCCEQSENAEKFQPGTGADVNDLLMCKLASLKIWTNEKEVDINGRRMTKTAALISLVRDNGFTAVTAKEMLKQAEQAARDNCGQGSVRYFVKLAAPWDDYEGPGGPTIPEQRNEGGGFFADSGIPQSESRPELIPATEAAHGDNSDQYRTDPINPQDMRMIDEAAQSGQKELFDASVIQGLIKGKNIDREITDCISGLFPGMDRLGRTLCLLYSHGKQFAERFGKADLQKLEDSLQSAFEETGDLVLFLETKQVDGNPQMSRLRSDLGE